jgi:hypothetical protein
MIVLEKRIGFPGDGLVTVFQIFKLLNLLKVDGGGAGI